MANPQRKRIVSATSSTAVTGVALIVGSVPYDDAPAVNVHGLRVTLGVSPFGPDETLLGRWYVVNLPPSINSDVALRNAWLANLNTVALANPFLESTEFVWGSGGILCAEQSTFEMTFAPSTTRNMQKGSELYLIVVADAISGVIDDWDAVSMITQFTS